MFNIHQQDISPYIQNLHTPALCRYYSLQRRYCRQYVAYANERFLFEIGKVAEESYRVLKKDKFCDTLMRDTRKKGMVQPLAFETMRFFEMAGFTKSNTTAKPRAIGKQTA